MQLETTRLLLRDMEEADYDALARILQDPDVMYAYEGAFSDGETREWLERQLVRRRETGLALNAVVLKETGEMIGQCGITLQKWGDRTVPEIGYLFQKAYWRRGYATEAARACRDYAFAVLELPAVYSIIRDTNTASQNVAKRNGMEAVGAFIKHYRGVDMPHTVYCVRRTEA